MKTIVEYNEEKPPKNAYPDRIVSPPRASPCCVSQMAPIGEIQEENRRRFIYKRCAICGFTVRSFESVTPSSLLMSILEGHWLLQHRGLSRKPDRRVKKLTVNPPSTRHRRSTPKKLALSTTLPIL